MDKQELTQILRDLDKRLPTSCEVVIVGGAAMILHFGSKRATRDVDALLLRGDTAGVRQAVKAVAEEHNLPDNWLSDAAKGFAGILPDDFAHRLLPLDLGLHRLRLYVLGRAEQVAMKIVALREQDLEDLELLMREMSDGDRRRLTLIAQHLAYSRPDWAQKVHYFMLEQGWKTE